MIFTCDTNMVEDRGIVICTRTLDICANVLNRLYTRILCEEIHYVQRMFLAIIEDLKEKVAALGGFFFYRFLLACSSRQCVSQTQYLMSIVVQRMSIKTVYQVFPKSARVLR